MKFSIIVPVYNVEEYIGECIDSVLNQSYSSYELILVDDGSADSSGLICDRYQRQMPEKIAVIHNTNQGAFLSRLHGAERANGEYVLFLDADDCLRSDALDRIRQSVEESSGDLVLFNGSMNPDYKKPLRNYGFTDGQVFQGREKLELYRMLVHSSCLNNVCLKAVKRMLVDTNNESFASGIKYGEDFLLSLQLLTAADRVVHLNQNLYYYRQRNDSTVHSFTIERIRSVKAVHLEAEKYIEQWGLTELRPGHYAREVRGWIDNSVLVLEHRKELGKRACRNLLNSMAEDPYFLRAYRKMDESYLNFRQRRYAVWLKDKKYIQLYLSVCIGKCISKCRRFLVQLRPRGI